MIVDLVPDGETSTLGDEPLATPDHLVRDLHEKRRHPLRRVVEARHLHLLHVKLAQNKVLKPDRSFS